MSDRDATFSEFWYRVRDARPALRSHARIHRHHYRGERWYVIQDAVTGRHHRVDPNGYYLIGLMDGQRTVHEIWEAAHEHLGDDAPSQSQTIVLLGQLHASDLLRSDAVPDAAEVFERVAQHRRSQVRQRWWSPLLQRIPMWDPDAFLDRGLGVVGFLARPIVLGAALALIAFACVLAAVHWRELSAPGADAILRPHAFALMLLIYVFMKALHELGHAFAVKAFGGQVHEMGVMLLVLLPVPYVDASAASAFEHKGERILVSAAGVIVEAVLASLALLAWLVIEDGALRTAMWHMLLIGGASTLLFNGNPLLRFDGYYVLADAIEIPNLAERSRFHLATQFETRVLGLPERRAAGVMGSEAMWLAGYGVASFAYRLTVLTAIALFVASALPVVGAALALWALASAILIPAARGLARLHQDPRVRRSPLRAIAGTAGVIATLALVLFVLPVPLSTTAEGVVWPGEDTQVRATSDGFVLRVLVEPGREVAAGEPLIETEDPVLEARVAVLEARLREVRARHLATRVEDRVAAEIVSQEIAVIEADLERARERADGAIIRSPIAGHFVLPRAQDWPGRFVRRGDVLGWVSDRGAPTVRTLVPESSLDLVRAKTRAVEVRLADRIDEILTAHIETATPAATSRLPSMALGAAGGGSIAIDTRDEEGLAAVAPVFQFDLRLPADADARRIGGRVYVRFDHGAEPLAWRALRALRRLFLGRLGV